MACDHKGGPELIEMAEQHLGAKGVSETDWLGRRFRWAENVKGGVWASVVVEIERRGDEWIVTRLDRSREPLAEEKTGFSAL